MKIVTPISRKMSEEGNIEIDHATLEKAAEFKDIFSEIGGL